MTAKQTLLDAFAELRRTWDDLVNLEPDIVAATASSPTVVALSELQRRIYAHESSLAAFIETVKALRATASKGRPG